MAKKTKKTAIPFDRVVLPNSRVDLIVSSDLMTDRIDVRAVPVLDVNDSSVVVGQSEPPLLKSIVGRAVEATVIHHDVVSNDISRWGWSAEITEFTPEYRLSRQGEEPRTVQAFTLSVPAGRQLKHTNVRMSYRIEHGRDRNITVQTRPSFGRASLLDFSAGGCRLGFPARGPAKEGMELWFAIFFPPDTPEDSPVTVNGEAEVVRVTYDDDDLAFRRAKVGLRFTNLDISSARALQRKVNFYMLEEQRLHNKNDEL